MRTINNKDTDYIIDVVDTYNIINARKIFIECPAHVRVFCNCTIRQNDSKSTIFVFENSNPIIYNKAGRIYCTDNSRPIIYQNSDHIFVFHHARPEIIQYRYNQEVRNFGENCRASVSYSF